MIDRVAAALKAQCGRVVVCGRDEPQFVCIPDRPKPGLGPLGGLNAAFEYARLHKCTHVLATGVDIPNLPHDIATTLSGEGAAIAQNQPVVGLWPVALAQTLDTFLRDGGRALYGFAETVGARRIAVDPPLMNVNAPGDLPR